MSQDYEDRLKSIREELRVCQSSLTYLLQNINDASTSAEFRNLNRQKLESTRDNLEDIFFVRLFAEFEGILKDHLRSSPNPVKFDDNNVKVNWLLAKALPKKTININSKLRHKYESARDYRNRIAHKSE